MVINIIFVLFISIIIISICFICISNFNMNLQKWAMLMISMFYGFIFCIVFILTYIGKNPNKSSSNILNYSYLEILLYLLSVILLVLGINFGYKIKTKDKGLINSKDQIFLLNTNRWWKKLFEFSILMLFISIVTYYIYSYAYGGLKGLLNYTMAIRIGKSPVSNNWSFFQKFGSFSDISGFCLFAIFRNKKIDKKSRNLAVIFWIISIIFSFYVIYSQGGRGYLINILLIYILALGFSKTNNLCMILKNNWKKFIILPFAFLAMNFAWKRAEVTSLFSLFASGYSYLFTSFIVNLHNYRFRYFIDLFYIPLIFLPSSLYYSWGIKTANQYNTFLEQGGYKGSIVNGILITGESTTGLLSFSYMQFSFIGVLVIGILMGMSLKKWDKRLKMMLKSPFKDIIKAYYVVYFVYLGIGGGDTSALVLSNFAYFIFFFLFKFYYKFFIKL